MSHRITPLVFSAGFSSRVLSVVTLVSLCVPLARGATTTVNGSSTTAVTLNSGDALVVNASGTLTISGGTNDVNVAGNSTIQNNGTIAQTGTGRGIRDNAGSLTLTVTNGGVGNSTAKIETADGDVIQMNKANSNITFYNYGVLNSKNASKGGNQAIDFNAVTSGTNTLYNYSTGVITASEADAVRPGKNGSIFNDGVIRSTTTTGSSSDGIDAQTNSGVSITNAFSAGQGTIEGGRHGITGGDVTGAAYTMTVTNNAGGLIQGNNGSGINIDGANANEVVTVTNRGTIIGNGVTADGDGVDIDGLVSITNSGIIRSKNSFTGTGTEVSEGVTVGGGTIVNTGTIEGLVASGNTSAVGRGITLAGVDKDASGNAIPIQGIYANSSITNSGTIRGQSDSGIAVLGPATGFTVTIDNQAGGLIEGGGATAATIQTGADKDTVINAGSIVNDGGDGKVAVSLGGGDDHLTVKGASASIVGGVDGGTGGETTGDVLTFDLGAPARTFALAGAVTNFEKVEALSGKTTLSGNNTYAGITNVGGAGSPAELRVTGRHASGDNYTVYSGGTLSGTGTIALASVAKTITVLNGGILKPGGGRLSIETGSLVVQGTLHFDLNGTQAGVASGYDQLTFLAGNTGTLTLGSTSVLDLYVGFVPALGQEFEIIDLQTAGLSTSGTFNGLAEGATFFAGGSQFQISYKGGTGNDVVLTAIPEPSVYAAVLGVSAALGAAWRKRRKARAQA